MTTIIKIEANEFGGHDNQTSLLRPSPFPDGWAILPEAVGTPETLENFPFGEITVDEQTPPVVTSWMPLPIPEPEKPTPAQLREEAYNTESIIVWDGESITVTEAAQLWNYYAAEGSDKAESLQILIAAAKAEIREKYPDEGVTV